MPMANAAMSPKMQLTFCFLPFLMSHAARMMEVTDVQPVNVALTRADYFTVSGVNFGPEDLTPSAFASGVSTTTVSWISETTILFETTTLAGRSQVWADVLGATVSSAFTFDGKVSVLRVR